MKAFRPRNTRLFMDEARAIFNHSPLVLKVIDRRIKSDGKEEDDLYLYEIKSFDIEYANNFFYPNDVAHAMVGMMVVPFHLNGDE